MCRFCQEIGFLSTVINVNLSPVHFTKIPVSAFFVLYWMSFGILLFYLFLLLYCSETTRKNLVGWPGRLLSFWQRQKVWYFHCLTHRQGDSFGALVTPNGGPTLSHRSAPRDRGSGVDHPPVETKRPKHCLSAWLVPKANSHSVWQKRKKENRPALGILWAGPPALPSRPASRRQPEQEVAGWGPGGQAVQMPGFLWRLSAVPQPRPRGRGSAGLAALLQTLKLSEGPSSALAPSRSPRINMKRKTDEARTAVRALGTTSCSCRLRHYARKRVHNRGGGKNGNCPSLPPR